MIDWLDYEFPYRAKEVVDLTLRQKFGETIPTDRWIRGTQIEGSWSGKIMVRAVGGTMKISGNPVKFLTGQNVVGINCVRTLARETYKEVIAQTGGEIPDCLHARRALWNDEFEIKRVDCTFHYNVGSDEDVTAWLAAAEESATVKNRGRGSYRAKEQTLYFGISRDENGKLKGSRRSAFKFYNKRAELDRHKMTCNHVYHDKLREIATGIVRAEATFRSLELRNLFYSPEDGKVYRAPEPQGYSSLEHFKNWKLTTPYDLHKRWIDAMNMPESVRLRADDEHALPRRLLSTYLHWKTGQIMQDVLSQSTFYRHRADLMEYGIDIALPPRDLRREDGETVVPVLRVIQAEPVDETDYEELFWELRKCG